MGQVLIAAAALMLQNGAAARIDAPWLAGCWQGEGLGAPASECWMGGPDGRMTGVFQLLAPDGSQRFSEIILIDVFEEGPAMRLKHFNADLTGWEAAEDFVSFPLIEQRSDALIFDGLEMQFVAPDQLFVDVVLGDGESARTERFTYTRVR